VLRYYFPHKLFASLLSYGFVLCGLGACAIHPVPENVTGVKTSQIVHRNRCEAREALRRIEDWLNEHNKQAAAVALQKIGIVLSYALDMQESDGLSASTNFEQLLTKGSFTFNPSAGDSLKRENRRAFTVADNYQTLMQMKCAAEPAGSNYQYPLVGTIGIDETIQTFLTMALHEDLNGILDATNPTTDSSKTTAASPTMVETLTFTTTINAGVTPSITLMPVGKATQLTSASLGFTWMRQDVHEVIVGLGMPTVPAPEGDAKKLVPKLVPYSTIASAHGTAARARTPLLIDAAVPVGTSPSSGPALALEAVNNQIIRFEALQQAVVVTP
jgi:hypothetical protein